MSISASGNETFRGIEELEQEDLIRFDTQNGSTTSPGSNQQIEVDWPIHTGDNEVFVVTDCEAQFRSAEQTTGTFDVTSDDFYTIRHILSTQTADDLTSDSRLAEDGLAVFGHRAYSTTVGHFAFESTTVNPTFENPSVMPYGTGEYSFVNAQESSVSVSAPRLQVTGYVMEVDSDTMTRLLRQRHN